MSTAIKRTRGKRDTTTMINSKRFRELPIGASFDWINDANPMFNSFYLRCVKTSERTYVDETGLRHRVGSIHANVYHVEMPIAA